MMIIARPLTLTVQNSEIPVNKALAESMERSGVMVDSNDEGLALVRGGAYAFIMETKRMEYLVTQDCSLQLVGGSLTQVVQGLALQKGGWDSACLHCCRIHPLQALQSRLGWTGPWHRY